MEQKFLERSLALIVAATCLMSLSGCGSLETRNQADKLERSVKEYSSALRWARHRDAISLHVTRDLKYAEVDIEYLQNFGVTSFDLISQTIIPSSEEGGVTEAIIVAEMSYFHKEQGTVRKLKLNQIWWYSTEFKHWLIESDFPEFK